MARLISLRWVLALVGLALVHTVLLSLAFLWSGRAPALGDAGAVEFALTANAAALASTLGILIALVLLIVQLTAQRYSFHVIDIFIRRPINAGIVLMFIVTITFNLALTAIMQADYVPVEAAMLALTMGAVCFALLLPYFYTLFATMRPASILQALEGDALQSVRRAVGGAPVAGNRQNTARKVQTLGDIALSAIQLGDAETAKHCVDAIQRVITLYLDLKDRAPGGWFQVEEAHFLGHHALTLTELEESRTWLEMRAFLELQRIFNATINGLSDVNGATAVALRQAAESALLGKNDVAVARLAAKFFNTLLRYAINRADIRSAYHLLYQYRILAERALEVDRATSVEIAVRLGYYGGVGLDVGLPWVAVTAAFDLRKLAENLADDYAVEPLLALSTKCGGAPMALREIVKVLIGLGCFALARQHLPLSTRLATTLAAAAPEMIADAVTHIEGTTEPYFWELTDRVINFDYLEPNARAKLADFAALVNARQAGGRDSLN